jgi:hypothetical protein
MTKPRISSSLNTTCVSVIKLRSTQSPVGRFGDPARSMPITTKDEFLAIRFSQRRDCSNQLEGETVLVSGWHDTKFNRSLFSMLQGPSTGA